jgi:hypothetical protein
MSPEVIKVVNGLEVTTVQWVSGGSMEPYEKPKLAALCRHTGDGKGKYLVLRRDGTVPEWPSFVLGARDKHAEVALRAYAASIATDLDCEPTLPESIRRLADEFAAYRRAHGDGDPTRGLHRKDLPIILAMLAMGQSG